MVDRVRSTTAFALATLVSEYGVDRHGVCAAEGCERVFADTSRNAARRYCSSACSNRSAVAAHRARAKLKLKRALTPPASERAGRSRRSAARLSQENSSLGPRPAGRAHRRRRAPGRPAAC